MGLLKEQGTVGLLQTAIDKIGKAVGDYLAGLALFFTNIKSAVKDGVNLSDALKEGGKVKLDYALRTDVSGTITAGGTAQTLMSVTLQGYAVYNPDATDLWISDSGTAAPNGSGSVLVTANGGWYETPSGYKHTGTISIYGATTGQKFTAKKY